MKKEVALDAFKRLYEDIDKDNHLFVGTINPEMIKVAINAIKQIIKNEFTPNINLDNTYASTTDYTYIPPACKACLNHPSNGGSGICHCILGLPQVIC